MEAPRPKHDNRDDPAAGGDDLGFLQLLELRDRRLQAAAFFLAWGCSTIICGTALNPSTNPEHVLAGFVMLTLGAALALLTLGGARFGRAAAQVEEALRGFF
ncbi:uncharacterized protein LOC133930335 [Phragmites australis]|uniref:uncharacterized protein LOC133930335 n=1 Tax=Phragmites australis TaxID=29695 RepID=UPI002D792046|nr:uncharacterized protein LOC133930335 [Phragmites australis]